jgi:hypothetical protein
MGERDSKTKEALDPLSSVLQDHAAVVIKESGEHGALSATEVLAWRSWFNQRRRVLSSSGGRPTNPKWTLKRQVPFSTETWEELEERARACSGSDSGQKIAPGQLAAFLLEESVGTPSTQKATPLPEPTDEDIDIGDPDFEHWQMPEPFAVAA